MARQRPLVPQTRTRRSSSPSASSPPQQASQTPPDSEPPSVSRPWQPRYTLGGIFLVMFVVSVMAAAGNYLVKALRGGQTSQLGFILFTLAAPLLLAVFLSVGLALLRRFSRPE